jgi:hypothetical protein
LENFKGMTSTSIAIQPGDVQRADRRSLWMAALLIGASFLIQSASIATESQRNGQSIEPGAVWLLEATSHAVILGLVPALMLVLNRAPLSVAGWRHWLPMHMLAALLFSAAHVLLMAGAREMAFPLILTIPYTHDLLLPESLIYEARKDLFTYALLTLGIAANRAIEHTGRETRIAFAAARDTQTRILSAPKQQKIMSRSTQR